MKDADSVDTALYQLHWMTLALFLIYLAVAMAMPATAVHVVHGLDLGNLASGVAVGIAFLSTILSRAWAGRRADERGGRQTVFLGLLFYLAAGVLCLASALPWHGQGMAYGVLLAGRLLLGLGESLTVVGILAWGMALMGPARAGKVMALVGMGMYGAFVLGGPLGLWLLEAAGFAGVMAVCIVLPVLGGALLKSVPGHAPARHGERPPFHVVLGRIWQPGAVVFLQGIGFAALGAFFPLYFIANGWQGAGYGLSCFGLGFVAVRLCFGHLPDRIGGIRVGIFSLAVEAVGQALLWLAPLPAVAFAGALLSGIGCSMVFPAMGLEAVKRVPPHLRGTAIGGFAAFQDLAYGATGPVAGWLADRAGHASVFLFGSLAALMALVLVVGMAVRRPAVVDGA